MSEYRLTEAFVARCFQAKTGKDAKQAAEDCAVFISICFAMDLIVKARIEAVERDEKALDLRGTKVDGEIMKAPLIGIRVGLCRSKVFEAISRAQARHHRALRRIA